MTTSTHTQTLPESWFAAAVARRPFRDTWHIGYVTKGGTYILASNGNGTDDGQPLDLLAILPAPLESGQVVRLNVTTNPQIVAELESALADQASH